MEYYVVKYSGPFGFIKPWTAVRDGITFSQQFLTPSTLEGIRRLLGVNKILRHKLSYNGLSDQQERIQSPGWKTSRHNDKGKAKEGWRTTSRKESIISRGILLDPELHLAFGSEIDALKAATQHICLCRNEDLLHPEYCGMLMSQEFDNLTGFELRLGKDHPESILVGYNRYEEAAPMHGRITITGNASMRVEI